VPYSIIAGLIPGSVFAQHAGVFGCVKRQPRVARGRVGETPGMADKAKPPLKKRPVSINARSVDSRRIIRMGSGVDTETPEWRQFTLGRLLLFAFNAYEARILASYRAGGFPEVRQVHFAVMRHIDDPGGTRVGDLATRAGVSKGAMGQLVAEFEPLGFVITSPDPSDARAKLVELSKRGRQLMELTYRASKRIEAEFAKTIGEEEFSALKHGLVNLRHEIVKKEVLLSPR
jgi:DNA-binding MarR family transcriptional regulator